MSDLTPTFVFGEDGKAYAYLQGKIVAAATDIEELEQKVAKGAFCDDHHKWNCEEDHAPKEGNTDEIDTDKDPVEDELENEVDHKKATHVITPNGLKGQIIGKQKSLWGDTVTIRLENGRVAKFDVTGREKYVIEKSASTEKTDYDVIREKLDETPIGTRSSLIQRIIDLKEIKRQSSTMVRHASDDDLQSLRSLAVEADYELQEVTDALAAMEEATPYEAPVQQPFDTTVVEQASLGGNDGTWLDNTLNEMVEEAEGQDFDTIMNEDPERLVSGMDDAGVADAGVVRDMAESYVSAKTAGLQHEYVSEFRTAFLERCEEVRRSELSARREVAAERVAKEASIEDNGSDEGLFW